MLCVQPCFRWALPKPTLLTNRPAACANPWTNTGVVDTHGSPLMLPRQSPIGALVFGEVRSREVRLTSAGPTLSVVLWRSTAINIAVPLFLSLMMENAVTTLQNYTISRVAMVGGYLKDNWSVITASTSNNASFVCWLLHLLYTIFPQLLHEPTLTQLFTFCPITLIFQLLCTHTCNLLLVVQARCSCNPLPTCFYPVYGQSLLI